MTVYGNLLTRIAFQLNLSSRNASSTPWILGIRFSPAFVSANLMAGTRNRPSIETPITHLRNRPFGYTRLLVTTATHSFETRSDLPPARDRRTQSQVSSISTT